MEKSEDRAQWIVQQRVARPRQNAGGGMVKIDEQIDWYDQNATRKDDDVIKANLNLIRSLYGEIEHSEDKVYLDKIIGTFCEIMDIQREVIEDILAEAEQGAYANPVQQAFVAMADFIDDKQLQAAFTAYCLQNGNSSYTVNDYCSRIRNLWRGFIDEQENGTLPDNLHLSTEQIDPDTPLLNAYRYAELLHAYLFFKKEENGANRGWANTNAAFRKFDEFCANMTP